MAPNIINHICIFVFIQMIRLTKLSTFLLMFTLLYLLIAISQAKLQVSNFAQMRPGLETEELKDIPYSIANFGFAPFGKTMVAHLQLSPGMDSECYTVSSQTIPKQIQNSFLLIPRGQCTFVTKALHAQEMGAKMAIIMDNDEHNQTIIMKDNGYGYKVSIPSIFINYKMGQKLLDLLNATNNKVNLKIFFQNIKTDKAEVVLYMQSFNRLCYYFIEQFQPFYQKIRNYVDLKLVYDVMNCSQCKSDDCYFKNQYCSVNYDHRNSANGKMVLNQQLREQIMFNKHFNSWWAYVACFNAQCGKINQAEECSAKCLNNLGMGNSVSPSIIQGQLAKSFDSSQNNQILYEDLQSLKHAGVETYPSISINSVRIKGSLNAQFVFDDICNTLTKPPSQCSKYIIDKQINITSNKMYWLIIVLVLVLSAALFTGLFIFCKRRMKRNLKSDMQDRVDDMVSKYIQFYSERNNKK